MKSQDLIFSCVFFSGETFASSIDCRFSIVVSMVIIVRHVSVGRQHGAKSNDVFHMAVSH